MSQRNSGYRRIARDAYETPVWVTHALCQQIAGGVRLPRGSRVWEPAAGSGKMVRALGDCGLDVFASDIEPNPMLDRTASFLIGLAAPSGTRAIITNPPYELADQFVETALGLMKPAGGIVAMLLKVDFDSAKTRRRFFADCPAFALKIVLVDRIHWFDPEPGKAGPSENHAWFVWDFENGWRPSIEYAAAPEEVKAELRAKRRGVATGSRSDRQEEMA